MGSGTLFGVALLVIFGLGTREMVGTDIYHAAILSSAAALGHVVAGNVNYPLVGSLLLGAVPGILVGSRLSLRLPEMYSAPDPGDRAAAVRPENALKEYPEKDAALTRGRVLVCARTGGPVRQWPGRMEAGSMSAISEKAALNWAADRDRSGPMPSGSG